MPEKTTFTLRATPEGLRHKSMRAVLWSATFALILFVMAAPWWRGFDSFIGIALGIVAPGLVLLVGLAFFSFYRECAKLPDEERDKRCGYIEADEKKIRIRRPEIVSSKEILRCEVRDLEVVTHRGGIQELSIRHVPRESTAQEAWISELFVLRDFLASDAEEFCSRVRELYGIGEYVEAPPSYAAVGCGVICSLPFIAFLIMGLVYGKVVWTAWFGGGEINADSNPLAYWFAISGLAVLCLLFIGSAIHEWKRLKCKDS